MVAAAVGIGSAVAGLAGSAMSSSAASSAANQQSNAANNAANIQHQESIQARSDLSPYFQQGNYAMGQLTDKMNWLTQPFNPTMDQLQQTPGYQFNLQQGLQAAQNGFASKGLGVSGAAMKGAADYASGLAANTLSLDQQIYSANQNNAFNKLYNTASLGENAAAGAGSLGVQSANNQAQSVIGGGNAQAAGTVGSANAWSSGINNASNAANQYMMYNMLNTGGWGGV